MRQVSGYAVEGKEENVNNVSNINGNFINAGNPIKRRKNP